jgi:hypothetical protein
MVFRFSDQEPGSSLIFMGVVLLSSLASWFCFAQELNAEDNSLRHRPLGLFFILGLIIIAFAIETLGFHNVLQGRSISLLGSDLNCFGHIVASSIVPALLSVFLTRNFLVLNKFWSSLFVSFHVAALGIVWIEMNCADREFWHLMFGHQSSVIGVLIFFMVTDYFSRARASLIS